MTFTNRCRLFPNAKMFAAYSTWFYGDAYDDAETYLKWASEAVSSGKKFVIIGSLGVSDDAKHYSVSALSARFLNQLGLKIPSHWNGQPFDVTYEYPTHTVDVPHALLLMIGFVRHSKPCKQRMTMCRCISSRIVLRRRPAKTAHLSSPDQTAVIWMPITCAIYRNNKRDGTDVTQWLVNPFEFFVWLSAPTICRNRMYHHHRCRSPESITATSTTATAGTMSRSLKNTAARGVISAQVILDKAIKRISGSARDGCAYHRRRRP